MTPACVLLLLVAIAADSPGSGPETERLRDADPWDCGTVALYHLLRLEGHPVELSRLQAVLGAVGRDGRSFRDLRRAGRQFGLALDAVLLAKGRTCISGPTLAFLKNGPEGHFVVVRPVGHTGVLVQMLDGEQAPVVLDAQPLFDSPLWTGLALVPHRTNYFALGAASVSSCCAIALGFRAWGRRRQVRM
jgi:ABC-type bacteriocin/lantibiotic exporter with double-glycine peptidase domain